MMKLAKWWTFIQERFSIVSTIPMILIFTWSHFILAQRLWGIPFSWISFLPVLFTAILFLFKLRLYDEIKDYEVDLKINPTRPLPRGLLTHRDLQMMIIFCITFEMLFMGWGHPLGMFGIVVAITYSLLMFKEFFIGALIRPHLTTYAVTHTFVTFWLSLALLSGFAPLPFWYWDKAFFLFALNSWCVFNLFEFARKTFVSAEERAYVESYSTVWGRYEAALLSSSMCWLSWYCLHTVLSPLGNWLLLIINVIYLALGLISAKVNRPPFGAIFRGVSSAVMILIYLVFILCCQ